MTRRTSVALLALLLASLCWLGMLTATGSAIGAKRGGGWRTARVRRTGRAAAAQRRARAASACRYARARPTRSNLRAVDAAIACLVNRERARHGLGALRCNRDLAAIAARQAADMVAGGYFGDDSRAGRTAMERVAASSYGAHRHGMQLGQNIAWGLGALATPQAVVASWMHSAPHRRIILTSRYRDMGAGASPAPPVRRRRGRGATYVLELAAP